MTVIGVSLFSSVMVETVRESEGGGREVSSSPKTLLVYGQFYHYYPKIVIKLGQTYLIV